MFIADAIGLTFTNDSVLLHHHYKTVVMTTMGLRVTTKTREQFSLIAASSSAYPSAYPQYQSAYPLVTPPPPNPTPNQALPPPPSFLGDGLTGIHYPSQDPTRLGAINKKKQM